MKTNDAARDRIEAAELMLRHAKQQHVQGNPEDAVEFLRAAQRNIGRGIAALERGADVIDLARVPRKTSSGQQETL